jgi:V8-like Glu-specific endopeptidase
MNRPLCILVIASALLSTAAGTAEAAPTAGAAPLVTSAARSTAVSAADQQRAAKFWTPDRMRAAQPLDLITVSPGARLDRVTSGAPAAVAPTALPNAGGPWTGAGAIVKTTGRVFFTFGGRTASCSGSAVTSKNKSTVITAGHCVKLQGTWHTNWVFVPAYSNGSTPYGTWTAKQILSTPQWTASENVSYDIGAAVVNPLGGQRLTDAVGGQGIAFNQARNQNMYAFGYPAAAPYDGSKLIYCSGRVFNEFLGTGDIGMTCNMTGGASGGPWFLQFAEAAGTGVQNSVNSFKYNFLPTWMFGPYFGADAQSLYNTAQAA